MTVDLDGTAPNEASPSNAPIAETAPTEPQLTDYDRVHLRTYLRLLDAAIEGASWEEATFIVLGIDVMTEPDRARRVHEEHLTRARWLCQHGYRELLKPPRQGGSVFPHLVR